MADAGDAMDHDRAGFGGTVERLHGLHDRRLRQLAGKDRADKIDPRHRGHDMVGVTPYLLLGVGASDMREFLILVQIR